MFTRIITSSLLFLIAIGGFVVSYDTGSIQVSQSYADKWATDQSLNPSSAPATAAGKEPDATKAGLNAFVDLWNTITLIITMFTTPAIMFASWLMSPDWSSGDLFRLREPMHKMWIIVSNIVYFVYAILLIMIALATIFGKDNFNYKTMLPKLALGILMVPFSWWFVQWTISIATVVTASVMTIPLETMKGSDAPGWWKKETIPNRVIVEDYKGSGDASSTKTCADGCTSPEKFFENVNGMYGSLVIYAYSVFNVDKVKNLSTGVNTAKDVGQILHQVVSGALMFLVFGVLVIALTAMLLIRGIKLWMYAVFSPIFTLHFVAGKELFGKGTESFDMKEFIGLCFLPAVVGLTLSFGLVIIAAVQSPDSTTGSKVESCDATKIKGDGCEIDSVLTITRKITNANDPAQARTVNIVKLGTTNIEFRGKVIGDLPGIEKIAESTASSVNGAQSALDTTGGIFGTIVVDIIALVFIWMAFMAAKGVTKAVDVVVKPFEEMGNKIGGMAMSLPKYAPLPIPGGSISGMSRTVDLAGQALDTHHRKKDEEAIGRLMPGLLDGTIKAEANARYQSAMGTDKTNFAKTREHVSTVVAGAKSERERNWEDIAKGFGQITDTVRKDWGILGNNLNEKQKEAYNKLLTGDSNGVKALSQADKEVIWRIFPSGSTSTTGAGGNSGQTVFDGNNAKVSFGNVNITLNNVTNKSDADQIAKAIKSAPGITNLHNSLSETDLIAKFKSINSTLTDDKIKEAVNRDLKDLVKESGGGGQTAS